MLIDAGVAPPALAGAAATAWLTLAARARAAEAAFEGFDDAHACMLAAALTPELAAPARDDGFVRGVVLRARWFDAATQAFLEACPGAAALTLGAGFCTRWRRLRPRLARPDAVAWLNVDLPEVIAWRERLVPPAAQERDLAGSLLEGDWPAAAGIARDRPLVVLLEGVCPYLEQAALDRLLRTLADDFAARRAPARLLLDFVHPALAGWDQRVGDAVLPLVSGFESVARLVDRHPTLRVIESEHPYARFSEGHRRIDAAFQALCGAPPYTFACLAAGAP